MIYHLAASANFSTSSTSKSDFKLSNELPYILNDGASYNQNNNFIEY